MTKKSTESEIGRPVTLKALAAHLRLHPATISVVLNDVPGRSVPDHTRQRIKEAARSFGYSPSILARSLRTGKTRTVGVILPDMSNAYYALIMNGLGNRLTQRGYCYMALHHGYEPFLVTKHIESLLKRSVDGLILIDSVLERRLNLPAVGVGCRGCLDGIAEITFDRYRAAVLAMKYFCSLGQHKILLVRNGCQGVQVSRIQELATSFDIDISVGAAELISGKNCLVDSSGHQYCDRGQPRNEIKAFLTFDMEIAATVIRVLEKKGASTANLNSVVCIDSEGLANADSRITVIRQPQKTIGQLAADTLLQRVGGNGPLDAAIDAEPELISSPASYLEARVL